MSDYNKSLPIRTDLPGDVDVFVSDPLNPSDKLKINSDGSVNVTGDNFDIRDLDAAQDSVAISDGTNVATVNPNGTLDVNLGSQTDGIIIAGTDDGTVSGTIFPYVNNIRLQILATEDRNQQIEYADFGTKNQRITRIDYTSSKFPGIIARKDITYTLIGNRYRRDAITWSIV